MNKELFRTSFEDALPALFGYFPLGLAFGVWAYNVTGGLWIGPLMSFLVYAGAAQFICMGIMVNNGTIAEMAVTTFVVNLRHVFYGIPFITDFQTTLFKKLYLIFGITDETYAILTATKKRANVDYSFWVTLFTHAYWVLGTIAGSLVGAQITYDVSFLNFALIALFIILAIEQAYAVKDPLPFILALISFILCQTVPSTYFLSACMLLCLVFTLVDFRLRGTKYEYS